MDTKKLRLLLINPVGKFSMSFKDVAPTRYAPLGLIYVAALTPNDWSVELLDENFEDFKFRPADIVGISSITSSVNRAYEIASIYKSHNIPVVLGGIHVSMLPDEALNYGNTVVIGEAESVWKNVLDDFKNGRLKNIYYGEKLPLDNLVFPRRDLLHKDCKMATIQTSRGCPMDCEFCSVTPFNGKQYRQRPIEAVLDELETIEQKLVFFVDDNLFGHGEKSRERAIRLFDGMIRRKINKYWWAQSSLNIADDEEVLKYAGRSGCKAIFIGIESINNETLMSMNKKVNSRVAVEKHKDLFRKLHKYGIAAFGAFILGNDTDDERIFEKIIDFVNKSRLDIVQATFSTPLPGTRLYERLSRENRIIFNNYPDDWKYYFFQKLVYKPKLLSIEEACKGMKYLKNNVYAPATLKKRFLRTFLRTKDLTSSVFAYKVNRVYQKLFYSYDYYKNY